MNLFWEMKYVNQMVYSLEAVFGSQNYSNEQVNSLQLSSTMINKKRQLSKGEMIKDPQ